MLFAFPGMYTDQTVLKKSILCITAWLLVILKWVLLQIYKIHN